MTDRPDNPIGGEEPEGGAKRKRRRGGNRTNPPKQRSSATFEDGDEPWRCRARTKGSTPEDPVRCGQPKVDGYNVCRYHGARGGAPIKHGRYSKHLGRFRDAYEEAMAADEDDLLDLREVIALLDVQVRRAAERAAECDTPEFRARALAVFTEARAATDPNVTRAKLAELGELLEAGSTEDDALDRLTSVAERLAVRQEKAWGVKLTANAVINARDLTVVLARLVEIVVEEAPKDAPRIIERIDRQIVGGSEVASRLPAGD